MKYIKEITTPKPGRQETLNIIANKKNVILIGKNGAGKTTVLKSIYESLSRILEAGDLEAKIQAEEEFERIKGVLDSEQRNDRYYEALRVKERLEGLTSSNPFVIIKPGQLQENYFNQTAVVEFFSAERQAQISAAESASNSLLTQFQKSRIPLQNNLETTLEQHIANLFIRKAIAIAFHNDPVAANSFDQWIAQFEQDLQHLTEDETTSIKFDPNEFKVYIKQEGKERYSLQNISSGYSSILSIFSRLLMRAACLKVTPDNLEGVALVDEIDVHLHLSLQKKVLPFLTNSFPNIQFIVSTHSPFILSSTKSSVIFDLTSGTHLEDLSAYSYESIIEGAFGVHSASDRLQEQIRELSKSLNAKNPDYEKLGQTVRNLLPKTEHLDAESRFFLSKAALRISSKNSDE